MTVDSWEGAVRWVARRPVFWAKFVGSGAAVCSEWCIEDVKSDTMQCMVHMRQLRQYSDSAQDYKWWCREVHQTIMWCVVHWRRSSRQCTRSRCVGDAVVVEKTTSVQQLCSIVMRQLCSVLEAAVMVEVAA